MQRFILTRIVLGIACFLVVSLIVFTLVRLSGDPVVLLLPDDASAADRAALTAQLGLDQPIIAQYGHYLVSIAHGDFGKSIHAGVPALGLVLDRFPATIKLSLTAMALALFVGLIIGAYSAYRMHSPLDILGRVTSILGQSIPGFWLGLMLIAIFAVWLNVLPAGGSTGFKSIILPAITLGWYQSAGIMRLTRSSMIDTLSAEYIKLARIKGVSETAIIWKHAFKNALIPVVTFSTLLLVVMLNGTVVTETVFAWPGVGRLVIQAIGWRDFPVIQAAVLIFSAFFIVANIVTDVLYAYINPKIRYSK